METEDLMNSRYRTYYIRSLTGDITESEQHKLEKWLAASSTNKLICDDLRKAWYLTKPPKLSGKLDIRNEWVRLEKSLGLHRDKVMSTDRIFRTEKISSRFSRFWNVRYRPALIAASLLVITAASLLVWKNPFSGSRFVEIITQNGERSQMILSDGSEIKLNAGSEARFRKSFLKDSRKVFLTGEAFFRVAKEDRPFIVITENAKTMVLGTQFNVWARNGETRVVVKSGCVKFTADQRMNHDVIIQKDQMCKVSRNDLSMYLQPVETDKILGWLYGKLVFIKTPFEEILTELERSYNISIETDDSELRLKTVTATFDHMDIDAVLTSLCLTLNARYTSNKGQFTITR
jgi:transmembrane sensor